MIKFSNGDHGACAFQGLPPGGDWCAAASCSRAIILSRTPSGRKESKKIHLTEIKDFRSENADYDKSNFLGIGGTEKTWEKAEK